MSDPPPNKFMPTGASGPAGPGAYVVPLGRARFILKGQFFHPIKESDQPLPVHQLYLFCVSDRSVPPVLGEPSQTDGVSWINFTLDAKEEVAGSTWALGWRPLTKDAKGAFVPTADVGRGDAWLDLEKMEWVDFKDVALVEKRKLLRLPLWASFMKAKQGGFKESPKKTKFGTSGLLVYDDKELTAYGEPTKPWVVQVDHGLFRSFVRYAYYDLKAKQRKPVPPGLVVQAIGTRALSGPATGADSRVAGGTALDDDGTVYLLHERTKANLAKSKFDYFFFTGTSGSTQHGIIDFSKTAAKDKVQSVSNDPSVKREERYVLPREWHSKGMQAWTKEDGKGFPQRKEFSAMRTEATTKKEPLQFHLDDALLAAGAFDPLKLKKDARVTLLDHLLHIREPDPKRPHFWKTKLARNYLPAEDAVILGGEGVERVTRIVFHEGVVYSLREKRIQASAGAAFGKTEGVGALAAIANDFDDQHRMADFLAGNPTMPDFLTQVKGRSLQHVIDVSDDVKHQVGGTDVKLVHLLSWVPIFFDNHIGAAGEDAVPFLNAAAERWDQTHPAHPNQPPANRKPAEIVLAPDGAITANARVVRVRHFFAEVPKTFTNAMKIVYTQSADPLARAGANCSTHTVTMFKGDIGPIWAPPADAETGQDDGTNRFTLAHEMGHVLGWPDDYIESHPTIGRKFAGWDQYAVDDAPTRPFGTDGPSVMNSNNKPRLRHYWGYATSVTDRAEFAKMVDAKPYFPVNLAPATGGPMVYERPFCEVLPGNPDPYKAIFPGFVLPSSNRCEASLYRMGKDEAVVERMYKKAVADIGSAAPAAKIFDGLLMIRIKFMVRLTAADNNAMGHSVVFSSIQSLCQDANIFTKQFVIEMDPPAAPAGRSHDKPHVRRVFVCFFPLFELENRFTGATPPVAVPGGHHIFVNVVASRPGAHPLLSPTPPLELPLLKTELDESLLLYALGQPTFTEDATTHVKTLRTTLEKKDLQFMANNLHGWLKDDPAAKRKASDT